MEILPISINKNISKPLYEQIVYEIIELIEKRILNPDSKLPSIRKLSKDLGVNSITIVNAYKKLEKMNYVYTKKGSGTFVIPKYAYKDGIKEFATIDKEPTNSSFDLIDDVNSFLDKDTINFASASPSPELFPVYDFKKAINEVLERDKGFVFEYQESQGFHPLRSSISNYLSIWGINQPPETIQIISGAQQGIDIISKTLLNQGDSVLIETPTYTGAIDSFKSRGSKLIQVPIELDGINLDILEEKIKKNKPKFLYTMPGFQNPTGYLYSMNKRKAILKLAELYQIYIIEDDHLTELNYTEKKILPLKSMDKNDRVIYIKSFSKILMPGLRLAFMIPPKDIFDKALSTKHYTDISTSGLIQRTFDLYLRKQSWKKYINDLNKVYRKRYELMKLFLKKKLPKEVRFEIPEGGLSFWLKLPEGYNSYNLYTESMKKNIFIVPGGLFYPDKKPSPYFRLSFASVRENDIPKGIELLSNIIRTFLIEYKDIKDNTQNYLPFI